MMALALTTPLIMQDALAARGMPIDKQDSNSKRLGYRQPGYVNQDSYTSDNIYGVENLAYYSDWDSNRIHIIDVDNMALLTTAEGTGDGPFGIDQQSPDKAMTRIIRTDRDQVTRGVGENIDTPPHDFGGLISTGHPLWADDHHFFLLDRARREIQYWNHEGRLLSNLETPTLVHHLFQPPASTMAAGEEDIYYAVAEGNQDEQISPVILRFQIIDHQLVQTAQVNLIDYAPYYPDASEMGAHHADFHPDGVFIYVGCAEDHVFVINKNTMEIETMVDAGPGAGHTTFLPMRNLAIITNHNATHMTVLGTDTHSFIRNIEVANSASPVYKSQAHTSGVSLDMRYFYSAASHDGNFFRIDLDSREVGKTYIGGNLLMGSFICNGDAENNM